MFRNLWEVGCGGKSNTPTLSTPGVDKVAHNTPLGYDDPLREQTVRRDGNHKESLLLGFPKAGHTAGWWWCWLFVGHLPKRGRH